MNTSLDLAGLELAIEHTLLKARRSDQRRRTFSGKHEWRRNEGSALSQHETPPKYQRQGPITFYDDSMLVSDAGRRKSQRLTGLLNDGVPMTWYELFPHHADAIAAAEELSPFLVKSPFVDLFMGLERDSLEYSPHQVVTAFLTRFKEFEHAVLKTYEPLEAIQIDQKLGKQRLSLKNLLGVKGKFVLDTERDELYLLSPKVLAELKKEGIPPHSFMASDLAADYRLQRETGPNYMTVSLPSINSRSTVNSNVLNAQYRDDPFGGIVSQLEQPVRWGESVRGYAPPKRRHESTVKI